MANMSTSREAATKQLANGKRPKARAENGKSQPPAESLPQRELLAALRAVRRGDFSVRLPEQYTGIDGQIAAAVNQIAMTAEQVGRDASQAFRAIAREGHTKARLPHAGLTGGWRTYVDEANMALDRLTGHMRRMLVVLSAVGSGDFSRRLDEDGEDGVLTGELLRQARVVNAIVDQLSTLGAEVTRVAHDIGVEGRLGALVQPRGARGAWRDFAESVNLVATSLTSQVREIARVTTAVAKGDLTKTVDIEVRGEVQELKTTINTMVSQLSSFAAEVTRVAQEVGSEGRLGGQARVQGVSGVWRELTQSFNVMAENLTLQVRNIAEVSAAIANGDLSKKITVEVRGELLTHKNNVNTMVDQLSSFAAELTRVSREVGTDGILGGQAEVRGASGVWRELTTSVNSMAQNLTSQVRNIAEVMTAIAEGDLSKKITVEARGEILALKNTMNSTVDRLNSFSNEVTRVSRLVGTEGRLGVQANVRGVSGSWKELTENVNLMASNLTNQVRGIAEVTTAVASGDLTRKITVDARGEILELKNTINTMVDQLSSFAVEVTRIARDVGIEGRLGGQADVRGLSGTWRSLTDAVNSMAANLTDQVRSISAVATCVAQGDLTRKVVVDARGEILELKNTINTMTDQLSSFAEEVTRVAREVGTEGILGGQASVEGVRGTWRDLTEAVNLMASNLTAQVRDIARVSTAIASGDLTRKVTVEVRGEFFELKNTINTMIDLLSAFADQVTRVARDVSVEGRLGGQAHVHGVSGVWKELTDNVNLMVSNLSSQVRDIADVTTAVANGDLSRKITVEVRGELLELKKTINTMVDQLNAFSAEVTRVAREVGTEGILGGQATVRGVSGIWTELTDNVNLMARNVTEQVRGIARVVTAVAEGDLRKKLELDASGEIATLVETINDMIDTLSTFTAQVSGVARDVGVLGKLGGQAEVPGAAGAWRVLTVNVNQLAENLTRQVRAMAEVATAVTKGDLTRTITVDAQGEVAQLKDEVNRMIFALAETTRVNNEQDWLKTHLTRFTRMLQGQRDLVGLAREILSELAPALDAQHGVFYAAESSLDGRHLKLVASYAYRERKGLSNRFQLGEGLVGQAALEVKRIVVSEAPPDYVQIGSGLGEAKPVSIAVAPIAFEGEVKGVLELASFQAFSAVKLSLIDQLMESLGIVMAAIESQMRTDELLQQSQTLAEELQTQQEELQQTNEELEEKARQLTARNNDVERKNRAVELGRQELEEKAEQLALTSRYKSQFLANMSHELRTPLNSLLILSGQLAANKTQNLTDKQVEYAKTIHQSGTDLLELINEILDLAKIESGTMTVDVGTVRFSELVEGVERSFQHVASDRGLEFVTEVESGLPDGMLTDAKRLRQILRNLLANAFKFTETGRVGFGIRRAPGRQGMLEFQVSDTGIGIPTDQHRLIFEAFQQADGASNRRYPGTGLGLAISRELAQLLGGEIRVESTVGVGSTFTLVLPEKTPEPRAAASEARPARAASALEEAPPLELPAPSQLRRGGGRAAPVAAAIPDDRHQLAPGDRVLLIIEDEPVFAQTLGDVAREHRFKAVVATSGRAALELVKEVKPSAITLDLGLPDMDGWFVLDRLKHDPATRHIPVHIISASDAPERRGLEYGAIAVLGKPVDLEGLTEALGKISSFIERRVKRLLVVEDDPVQRQSIVELIGTGEVSTTAVGTAEEALAALGRDRFDCVVLDLRLPDLSGLELMKRIKERAENERMPIVIYTGKELTKTEETDLRKLAQTIIIKDVKSPERLLDETALFLHRVQESLPESAREMLRRLPGPDPALAAKRVLVVDDDVRNIFAITTLLEEHEMVVDYAENGDEALAKLSGSESFDVVLMDIMMPGMDGYEACRRIREMPRLRTLPIIALTAKAMKGDRDKCILAGASDYITKPVDTDQLISLLRVWLYK
jgi:CheY-like chemotaxis protein/HAMP domain-containing protein/signal transduction histidine kinase